MGLLGKILVIAACAIGVVCTLGAIIANRERLTSGNQTGNEKAAASCMFIAFFIFAGVAILIFITFCCPYKDLVVGIAAAVAAGAAREFQLTLYNV
ncbi:uncharacterized protein DEA37_0010056 [Paragonimus westermani]|uniref:Uncharacterized protein n=1 Tax=Paragonimus westermani TaxID=34504 RepID=A0A5J4NM97_9TREM|nr:uncharacterized protein DEA37_0010056 [Paragonimus westermani]